MADGIIVLGMHRSGTSAISGTLKALGVNLGNSLIKPQENVNEKGFYEAGPVIDINNSLLCHMGSYWDDLFPSRQAFPDDKNVSRLFERATKFISSEFNNGMWAIKEPRMSVLLPFWEKVFDEVKKTYVFLYIFRHPEEVYASLHRRDGFSREKSYLLWLKYNLEAEFNSRGYTRHCLEYTDLFDDVEKKINDMQGALNIEFPKPYAQAKASLDEFLTTDLRNNVASKLDLQWENSTICSLALELYQTLLDCKGSNGEQSSEKFDQYLARYRHIFEELPRFVNEHYQSVSKQRGLYENMFLEAYNSKWWKTSMPIRWIEKRVRKLD
jgi:hypothetical protein